ncbi:MAG: acyl-ACP--UDP-N-acetylglucosamine O-acyltransferase [Bdellovibrionaceae bacterium]|nr:acyl-ACP--UDP-N-acetylglucosamine O-acyltransferase [Pseudobdellovibrionaceae bacterium]
MKELASVHPTAIVHPEARLGRGTVVGPFSIIGEHVRTGENCEIKEHVIIQGHTQLGDQVKIYPNAVVGYDPQHLKYAGEPTRVEIGDRSILREGVTVHRATEFGNKVTRVGKDVFLMAYVHVAHDCLVGDGVVIANAVQLAGHVTLEEKCTVGGQSAIAQHCRVGRYAYVGGGSIVRKDMPPFMLAKGTELRVQGVNQIGLKRTGLFSDEAIRALKNVFRLFYLRQNTTSRAMEDALAEYGHVDEVRHFVEFVRQSKLGIER